MLIIRSSLNHSGFFIADSVSVMFDVSVLSIASWHVHGADVIGVAQTWGKPPSNRMEIMRHPAPFTNLNAHTIFHDSRGNCILHSDSFLLSVSERGSSAPIPGENVVIHLVHEIGDEDIGGPHTERTVTVDGVLLEISIHFVSV